jgi:hypothetical protein
MHEFAALAANRTAQCLGLNMTAKTPEAAHVPADHETCKAGSPARITSSTAPP